MSQQSEGTISFELHQVDPDFLNFIDTVRSLRRIEVKFEDNEQTRIIGHITDDELINKGECKIAVDEIWKGGARIL